MNISRWFTVVVIGFLVLSVGLKPVLDPPNDSLDNAQECILTFDFLDTENESNELGLPLKLSNFEFSQNISLIVKIDYSPLFTVIHLFFSIQSERSPPF